MQSQHSVQSTSTQVALQTAFGLGRVTLYLLLPALGASALIRMRVPEIEDFLKLALFLGAFVLSWILIACDYWFIMRNTSFLRQRDTLSQDSTEV